MPDRRSYLTSNKSEQNDESDPVRTRRSFLKASGVTLGVGSIATRVTAGTDHELVVASRGETSETGRLDVSYRFTTTDEITKVEDGSTTVAEQNDSVVQNDDGTWTAEGTTGNGFADAFLFDGRVLDFTASGSFELRLDGSPVTVDDLTTIGEVQFSVASLTQDFTTYALEVAAAEPPEAVQNDDGVGDHLLAENGDAVTQVSDGLYRIEGRTGTASGEPPAYGDTFRWVPASDSDTWGIQQFTYDNATASDLSITINGSVVPVEELSDVNDVQFSLASLTQEYTTYELEVSAAEPPQPVRSDASVEDHLLAEEADTVTQVSEGLYRIEGRTGTASGEPPAYGDTFRWRTAVDTWGIRRFAYDNATASDLSITINDDTVDPSDLPGSDGTGSTGPTIGGGDGYQNTVPRSEATYLVTTLDELVDAVGQAARGDVVYVPGGTTIDAGSGDFQVPAGVTLASDRGIDGAPGGRIRFTRRLWPQITLGDDVRVTGLRIEGIDTEYHAATDPRNVGMETVGDGVEIDNCELAGFRGAAISASGNTHVHHCSLHDNPMDGLGYGVMCVGGHPTIEYCYLTRNRHGVMSTGTSGYTARYNIFGETSWGIPIDVHDPGNGTYEISNNTVRSTTWPSNHASRDYDGTELQSAIQIRGTVDGANITDNWFYNPEPPAEPADGYGPEAIVKADPADWGAVHYEGNHYGEGEPDSSTGHPR